ncbi:MAG: pilus assembly protein [Xanthobacteraceae bacterium]|nr:pilus assembly protein [Xanthobacteraceae bacterium]
MKPMIEMWLRARRSASELLVDRSGLAAIEFAMIVPLMLLLFFGTDEFSSAVAVNRKVTLMARTVSDLTSQNISVTDAQLTNFFNASKAIMTPYPSTPVKATVSELYIDPATKVARVQWSKGAEPRGLGTSVTIPTALQVGGTYLIYSEVNYAFVPTIGYVMKSSITLKDFTFTRPRQSLCVMYATTVCTTS